MQQVDFSIIRSEWMLNEASAHDLFSTARDYLAGRSLNVGFFSKLSLPDVPDNVALIPINGVMTKADICGGMGNRSLANAVTAAANDTTKQSIILFFESVPGGQVDGTQEFADAIKMATSTKTVVSVISGMCASAGVWAASQSHEIYAMASTDQFGCIGVLAKMRKNDSEESDYEVVYSDLSPDKNAEFRDPQLLKDNYLNPTAKLFQEAVMSGRGDRLKTNAKGVLSGTTFIAQAAKKNGLIDGVMSFPKILQRTNYLSKKQNSSTMATKPTNGKHVFQSLLKAAGADAFIPVEEGFAMTEDQMTAADAHIDTLTVANKTLTNDAATNATALQAAKDEAATATTNLANANTKINDLNARIVEMGAKPAPVVPNPTKEKDPVEAIGEEFLTSADKLVADRKAKFGK